ncbi:uncharacterized protein BT62DRAFT_301764 [Guyanagaster necrorhizus]|uniref:Uncharacterized protein n=1 Tax=Guyanagaster necrorhizus TaxID=856835 RepID=A0A9P7W2Y2_9AGAR|nr:uncharacterized protein BT62DRAFT_301764 [Guyanagaster necrorhizus MCA 3950]KAG7452401.1 hypothetical protein BT62DRAFT_301764 [Guyanagaster necrorhizus MCA 3950]
MCGLQTSSSMDASSKPFCLFLKLLLYSWVAWYCSSHYFLFASILVNDLSSASNTSRTYHITHSFVPHRHWLLLFASLCRYILSCAIFLLLLFSIMIPSHPI